MHPEDCGVLLPRSPLHCRCRVVGTDACTNVTHRVGAAAVQPPRCLPALEHSPGGHSHMHETSTDEYELFCGHVLPTVFYSFCRYPTHEAALG